MANKKISQLTALGGNFTATDLFEISQDTGGGTYASKKITGAELSASISASIAIGDTVTSGTEGSVLFLGAAGVLAQDNANFFWDDTNNRLGIGTASPSFTLHVLSAAADLDTKFESNGGHSRFIIDSTGTDDSILQFNEANARRWSIYTDGTDDSFKITRSDVPTASPTSDAISIDSTDNVSIPNGTLTINDYTFPAADGAANQIIQTDGAGNLSFAAASGGGASDINGLTDAKVTASGGTALQYSIWMANGDSAGSAALSGTLNDARANLAIGPHALKAITEGDYNIALGYRAGYLLTTSSSNIIMGYGAGMNITTGNGKNVLIGKDNGNAITTAESNVSVGDNALGANQTGGMNVAIGQSALNVATYRNNIGIGRFGGGQITSGQGNTAIGYNTMYGSDYTGSFNVVMGYATNPSAVGISREYTIGYSTGALLMRGTYATDGECKLLINGATTDVPSATLHVKGQGTTSGTTSLLVEASDGDDLLKITDDGEVTVNNAYALPTAVTGANDYVLTAQTDGSTAWAAAGGGGASVLNDLTDVECTGTGAAWNFFKNGATADGVPQHGTLSSAERNIALGAGGLASLTTGDDNISIGYYSGFAITEGEHNIVLGYQSAKKLISGDKNIAIGETALHENTTAGHNVAIGTQACYMTTGYGNIGIGNQAGRDISSGTANIVIGYSVNGGSVPTTGDKNIALGMFVGVPDPTADGQLVVGHCHTNPHYLLSGDYATSNQSKLGINLGATGTGNARAAVAPTATLEIKGQGTTDSTPNLLIKNSAGTQIMKITDSGENICIGATAGDSITAASGLRNILLGLNAGTAITTADNNICIGAYAGQLNTASGNMFIGYNCGGSNTTGTANTFIGYSAGLYNVDWQNSTYVGYQAGYGPNNEMNTAVGTQAMYGGSTANTAEHNTAIGYQALYGIDDNGDGNVAVGWKAGNAITSGTNNTVIGYDADANATGTNQIACGNGAVASGSNVGIWGNASVATNNITVDWTVTSDERIKENIEDASLGLDFINALKPKTYTKKHPADWDEAILEPRFKEGGSEYDEEKGEPIKGEFDTDKVHNGLIAQDLKAAMDSLGVDFSGWNEDSNGKQGIQYAALVMPLIKAVQELSAKVKELENK